MITDAELAGLPDDPELAFIQFEQIVRGRLREDLRSGRSDGQYVHSAIQEYANKVVAAAKAFEIDALKDWQVPVYVGSRLSGRDKAKNFMAEVDHHIMEVRIRRATRTKKYSVELDQQTKAKVRHYIDLIKEAIDKSDVPIDKRDILYSKLNDFAIEVDRARTNLQAGMAAIISVCDAIGQGAKKLEPARKWIDSISTLLGRAKALEEGSMPKLPAPAQPGRLPAPESELALDNLPGDGASD